MTDETGIYTITSPSGEMYVGSAVNFTQRWAVHKYELRKCIHHSVVLQRAWNKYGEASIVFAKIFFCAKEDLIKHEQAFIDQMNPKYNACKTAGSRIGICHSEITRAKISAAVKGRIVSEETRRRLSAALKGKAKSPEHRKALSISRTGSVLSEDTKLKISKAFTGRRATPESRERMCAAQKKGKDHPLFGTTCSEEERTRQRESSPNCIPVLCKETGQVFHSARAASRWLHGNGFPTADSNKIGKACRGKLPKAYGYTWAFFVEAEERRAA